MVGIHCQLGWYLHHDLKEEFGDLFHDCEIIPLSRYFDEEFFSSKKLVYLGVK